VNQFDKVASTSELLREVVDETRELVKLEVALAKNDLEAELSRARSAAIALVVAAFASNLGLAMVLVAAVVASRAEVTVAAGAAFVLLVTAAVAGSAAYRKLSSRFFLRTRERIGEDARKLGARAHGT
jgi:uncharacterized membrane protein YqjE